jgi:hypothetical protein
MDVAVRTTRNGSRCPAAHAAGSRLSLPACPRAVSYLRAQGTGFAAAFSRIGAAGGTFLLPLGIAHIGLGPSVLIGAVICAIGLAVTYLWAPETTDVSLTRTSSVEPVAQSAASWSGRYLSLQANARPVVSAPSSM